MRQTGWRFRAQRTWTTLWRRTGPRCCECAWSLCLAFNSREWSIPPIKKTFSFQCETDWLTIPCATNTNDPTAQDGTPVVCVDRICGMVFNSATTQAGSPNVPVYSKCFMRRYIMHIYGVSDMFSLLGIIVYRTFLRFRYMINVAILSWFVFIITRKISLGGGLVF